MANKECLMTEALEAIRSDDSLFAIWMIENAAEKGLDAGDMSRLMNAMSADAGAYALSKILPEVSRELETVIDLCQSSEDLSGEEWMVVVSYLSTAFAVKRYAERLHCTINLFLLEVATRAVEKATNHFCHPAFRAALREARRRYPNPLPPPL